MKINKKQLLAIRCDICHQTDSWDIYEQKCSRCFTLALEKQEEEKKKLEKVKTKKESNVVKKKIEITFYGLDKFLDGISFAIIKFIAEVVFPLAILFVIIVKLIKLILDTFIF